MKKICLQILIYLGCLATGLAQNCISDTLTLSSQQDIDDFSTNYPGCTNIEGTLIISAPDLISLNGLSQVAKIETALIFENNTFTDLSNAILPFLTNSGSAENTIIFRNNPLLNNLAGIGSYLDGKFETIIIENNPSLLSMNGFDSDGDITGGTTLRIIANPQLTTLTGMETLLSLEGTIEIINNPLLTALDGLDNINIFDRLNLTDNPLLTDISALSQLTTFDKGLTISGCASLSDLTPLQNLIILGDGKLVIDNNNALTNLNGLNNLTSIKGLYLTNNPNLSTIIHLINLTEATQDIEIINNPSLVNLNGLQGISAVQGNLILEDLPSLTDLVGLSNLAFVGNNFDIESISLSIPDLSDLENLETILGNIEIKQTGFITLAGLENITAIGGLLYLQQNDAMISVEALSNLTTIGDDQLAVRFNDILPSLFGLHNIDPNSIDELNLFENPLLNICALDNFCSYLANGGDFVLSGNQPLCNENFLLAGSCQLTDPKIVGKIYIDENENCINDGETPLNDAILKFDGLLESYYATSDIDGFYEITLPAGNYTISVINFSDQLWEFCNNSVFLSITDNQQIEQDFGLKANPSIPACPKPTIDISGGALLPCESTVFQVNYCNIGTLEANEVAIDLTFDDGFAFIGSSQTVSDIFENTYTFELANLAINECVTFDVTAIYDPGCTDFVTGQTACVTAKIRPNDYCLPVAPTWDGSSLRTSGFCDGDSIRFFIINDGLDMTSISNYIITEDNLMMRNEPVDVLGSGDTLIFTVPASGTTFRMEADQTLDHPGFSRPSYTVEGCDPDGDGVYSLGFYRQYPQDDIDAFIDIECMTVLDTDLSNEKTADPIGVTEEHCIQKNIPIEYTYHFQNTGTTTVQEVIIQDELSPFLDITSIQAGSSSHLYDFEVIDNGRVQFTFPKINLPDSTTNLEGSRGFVSFKIGQKANNVAGAIIESQAVIFYDTTQLEVTDMVFHLVSDSYCIDTLITSNTELTKPILMEVFPNPFEEYCVFEWQDLTKPPHGTLILYDMTGRIVDKITIKKRQTMLHRHGLSAGVYFYELVEDDGLKLAHGKLMSF